MHSDRRCSTRVPCHIQAYIQRSSASGLAGRELLNAQIEQMSDTGVRLRASLMVPEGERVTLFLGRDTHPVAYRRDLEVVWTGKHEGPQSCMGGRMLGKGFQRCIGSMADLIRRK